MSTIIQTLKNEYVIQKKLLDKLSKRYKSISQYKIFTLTHNRKRNLFYMHKAGDPRDKRTYCKKSDKNTIAYIQEAKYISEAIKLIDINLLAINNFLKVYRSPYPIDVIESLGLAYQNLDNISRSFRNHSASEWLKRKQAEKAEHIKRHGEYYPEMLKHRTIDGTLARSKSEVSIYNYLLMKGVTFIYEPIMIIGGEWKRPDFLILTSDGRELIIEHLGLSGDAGYLSDQFHKIETYIANNWVPNVNLLLTFDDKDGNIDMSAISKMIDAFLS